MRLALWITIALLGTALAWGLAGCSGSDSDIVVLEIENLSPITNLSFTYTAWLRQGTNGSVVRLDDLNVEPDGTLRVTRFSRLPSLGTGDQIFVTIEPNPDPDLGVPTETVVLRGTFQGGGAVLLYPRLQEFPDASGTATVSGAGNRQLLTEFEELPDVSGDGMIYQGWLDVNGNFFPLPRFSFDEVPVSYTASLDLTIARYFLSIEPLDDPHPTQPTSIRPFFTNGPLQPIEDQPLTRSSLTPGSATFNFPRGVATIQ